MAERHLVRAHHPIDHRAARVAAEAVPEVRLRGDDAGRGVIAVVPRTTTGEILALGEEPMPLALDQAGETHLTLQPLELGSGGWILVDRGWLRKLPDGRFTTRL